MCKNVAASWIMFIFSCTVKDKWAVIGNGKHTQRHTCLLFLRSRHFAYNKADDASIWIFSLIQISLWHSLVEARHTSPQPQSVRTQQSQRNTTMRRETSWNGFGHCCMCFAALLFFNTTTKTLTDRSLLFEAQRITWYWSINKECH